LKQFSNGKYKDRLLGDLILDPTKLVNIAPYQPEVLDSLLLDATKTIKLSYVNESVDRLLRRKKGSKVNYAQFISLDGRNFDLKQLQGKVVLLDVWYVGCVGCANFHERFEKEAYPLLKNNKDFAFLSVSLESDKTRWLNGIKSNLYSSDSYINVTTGKWLDHPFMKYYNVLGGPFLMLIDKNGNIYSAQSDYMAQNASFLLPLINEALYSKPGK
jgi:hypothetical protein